MERSDMDTNDRGEMDRMIAEQFSNLRADDDWHPNVQSALTLLREKRAATNGRRRRWVIAATGAVAACIPIMAFPVTRALAARCVSACVVETAAVRQLLLGKTSSATLGTAYVRAGERRMAPDFTLSDSAGRAVQLSEFRGKVVLLNFWATWCGPCKQEIPWFVEFQRTNEKHGFAVLGVSMDEDGWRAVKPYMEATHINYPVMLGNDDVAKLFGGLDSLPLTIIIDRAGRIAAVHAGLCRRDEYESDINAILNER
jgi:peroxiredoxin